MTNHTLSTEMQSCIDACSECHTVCLQTAMTHCLEMGGLHVEPEHFRLMINCAEICQTSANFMLSNSPVHAAVCGACAEVCDACAVSCARISGMEKCADICRRCAQTCATMGKMARHGLATGDVQHAAH